MPLYHILLSIHIFIFQSFHAEKEVVCQYFFFFQRNFIFQPFHYKRILFANTSFFQSFYSAKKDVCKSVIEIYSSNKSWPLFAVSAKMCRGHYSKMALWITSACRTYFYSKVGNLPPPSHPKAISRTPQRTSSPS